MNSKDALDKRLKITKDFINLYSPPCIYMYLMANHGSKPDYLSLTHNLPPFDGYAYFCCFVTDRQSMGAKSPGPFLIAVSPLLLLKSEHLDKLSELNFPHNATPHMVSGRTRNELQM